MPSSTSTAMQSVKVSIYFDMVSGRSARETAQRFSITHPTATKYAADALDFLRVLPAVVTNPELAAFLSAPLRNQVFGLTPALQETLVALLQPFLDEAASAIAPVNEPSLTISFRLPESVFYRFQRLVKAVGDERGAEVTISSLGAELIASYVDSATPPVSEAKFKPADGLMDDMRQLLAKYGITSA